MRLVLVSFLQLVHVLSALGASPVVNITAKSASLVDGSTAVFLLNGDPVEFESLHGFNLIVFHRNGTVRLAKNFDTRDDAAVSRFAVVLSELEQGTPVAVASQGDVSVDLTDVASILRHCCFADDFVLEDRGRYSLVSVAGIAKLAESHVKAGSANAIASAIYQELPPLAGVSVSLRSGNMGDGEFSVNGAPLECNFVSFLTLAALENDGSLRDCKSFDAGGGDTLETEKLLSDFLATLAEGTPVLAAVAGGQGALSAGMGATLVPILGSSFFDVSRQPYVSVRAKGGALLAEKVGSEDEDYAEIVLVGASVLSAGFDDGNTASFVVNGKELRMAIGRGLNVAVLNEDGSANETNTFDTHLPAGCAELVKCFDRLAIGAVVLVSAVDEASESLDSDTLAALASIGGVSASAMRSRDSYALIGAKGHSRAIAELRVQHRSGLALVAAHWPSTQHLPRPRCGVFQCPETWLLRADAFTAEGHTNLTCCVQSTSSDVMSIAVESAGWDDGNFARFHLDAQLISVAVGRGLNLVVLRVDGSVEEHAIFDTDTSGSDSLVAFVDDIEEGKLVLVAAADEAAGNLTDSAREAIRTLGATKIGEFKWRGSYALVGSKWNPALAEAVTFRGHGPAKIVAHYSKILINEVPRPLCDGRAQMPPVRGYLSNGQLKLQAGCRYGLYTASAAGSCLEGAWVVVAGGSNTVLMTINLANLLAPGALDPIDDRASMGMTTVIDLVIENGTVVYNNSLKIKDCTPEPFNDDCRRLITAELDKGNLPKFNGKSSRVTQIVAQYWDHVDAALDAVEAEKEWAQAEVAFVTQVSAWYIYCSVKKVPWCPRHELIPKVDEAGLRVFESDMAPVVSRLRDFCAPSGRAGVRGCVVGTTSWQNPPANQAVWYQKYNDAITNAVLPIASKNIRVIDFWELGMAMPTECILGHGSPVANIWSWQVMLSGFCKPSSVSPEPYAIFDGDMCFAADAEMAKCPHYRERCPNTFRCERWECASSVACTLVAGKQPARKAAAVLNLTLTVHNVDFALLSSNASLRIAFSRKAKAVIAATTGQSVQENDIDVSLRKGSVVVLASVHMSNETALKMRTVEMNAPKSRALLASAMVDGLSQLSGIESVATGSLRVTNVDTGIAGDLQASDDDIFPEFPLTATEEGRPCRRLMCFSGSASEYIVTVVGMMVACIVFALVTWWSTCFVFLLPRRLRERVSGQIQPSSEVPSGGAASKSDTGNPRDIPPQCLTDKYPAVPVLVKDTDGHDSAKSDLTIVVAVLESQEDEQDTPEPAADDAANPDLQQKSVQTPGVPVVPDEKFDKQTVSTKKTVNPGAAGDRFPLGMARFCASLHVVVGHLYAKGVTPGIYFFGWGFTWVPWFFMLSGFVLFTAHLRRPKQEGVVEYVLRRSVTIYPLYAVSLLPAILVEWFLRRTPMSYAVIISQSFLAQAWNPMWAEYALQQHCWFLSCMVVYWLCFKPLARCLVNLKMRGTLLLMTALFMLPWLVVVIPAAMHTSGQWYKGHSWKATDSWLDLAVVSLKFSPLCYAHIFILGMLLAKLRLLLDAKVVAAAAKYQRTELPGVNPTSGVPVIPLRYRLPMEFVMPAGYLGLLAVFVAPDLEGSWAWASSWGYKLSARLSLLLPLQAAILIGLAGLPSLPLPRGAALMKKLDFLQNYSYCVYVLQWLCYDLWPVEGVVNVPLFLVFVVSAAVAVSHTVQKPVEKWWSRHARGRIAVPFVLAGMLCILNAIPHFSEGLESKSAPELPAFVRLGPDAIDVRLPLMDAESNGASLINPSILVRNGEVLVVARRHRLEYGRWNGEWNGSSVTFVDKVWQSQIMVARTRIDDGTWASWPTTGQLPFSATLLPWSGLKNASGASGSPWTRLCAAETYIPGNKTLMRVIVTGPEDAKVFVNGDDEVDVAFSSLPPRGYDGCPSQEAVPQMYLATNVDLGSAGATVVGQRLQCGRTDKAEKNWIPFRHEGRLLFVYTPVPHTIVAAEADGQCKREFSTEFQPLLRLQRRSPELEVRGSGQAVLVDNPEATPLLPQEHYFALLHMFNKTSRQYAHFAYRFSASPPFAILQVSTQLSLMTAVPGAGGPAIAFASGLSVHGDIVSVTYGAGDRDARALSMTLKTFDRSYFAHDEDGDIAVQAATGEN